MELSWISDTESMVVQIATPYTTGTGFVIKEYGVIVTNEHVVRDNRKVVIESKNIERQLVDVLYLDEKNDVAFLFMPDCIAENKYCFNEKPMVGDIVFAFGHPFGLKFSTTKGIISSVDYELGGLRYIQHDAALNPGNSGGPLFTARGELLGINTFIAKEGQNIGIALPMEKLHPLMADYQKYRPNKVIRCQSCEFVLEEGLRKNNYCSNCGAGVRYISDAVVYEAEGICKKLEDILRDLGYDVDISRRGIANWEISKGSAVVNISYNEKSGFLVADATLCYLPKTNMENIYTYLMKQNYLNKGMTFSLKDNNIVISSLIYDQHMHYETCKKLIDKLIKSADAYDNILIEQFGAVPATQWSKC